MYEALFRIVQDLNGLLTSSVLLVVLVGVGLWFTLRLGFVQIRAFGLCMRQTFKGLFKKDKTVINENGMTSFQALTTAMAAQVGTGNIVGVASAIAVGGPGAVFWMWVSAFLGMATIYAEAMMAQKFKYVSETETVTGGPVYYIRAAFRGTFGKVLSAVFALLIVFALGFMGNAVQSNSIAVSWERAFGVPPMIMGVALAVGSLVVFSGGIKRIAKVTENIVPLMLVFYIVGALVIICMHIDRIPVAFHNIIVGAFNPEAIVGGATGATIRLALTKGIARGLFSNEAGMGSTPHAHAVAKVNHPVEQGIIAMAGVFIDTFVILNLTAFVIIMTGSWETGLTGAELSQYAFTSSYGRYGEYFIAICMLLFAFSTIISWYYFGASNIRYLFGSKGIKVYAILVAMCVVGGSLGEAELIWSMSDCFNSLMVIPNIIALFALTGVVSDTHKEYWNHRKKLW